jgi:thymidine phosphorylase
MNQPLGSAVGNSIELIEAFEALKGRGPADFILLCRELSAEMLMLGGVTSEVEKGRMLYDELIESGAACKKMRAIIQTQGGDGRVLDNYDLLPRAAHELEVNASEAGYVHAIDTEAIGRASMLLGAGRSKLEAAIDLGVGLTVRAKIGDKVERNASLVMIHFNDAALASEAEEVIRAAYTIGEESITPPKLIKEVLR